MDDLHLVAVGIAEVARARAVAVRLRLRVERHTAAFEKRRPPIHIIGRLHDHAKMIERGRDGRSAGRTARRERSRTVESEIVDPRRQVQIVGVRLPLHLETKQIDVEAPHRPEIARVQREVAQAEVRRAGGRDHRNAECTMLNAKWIREVAFSILHSTLPSGTLPPCLASRSPSRGARSAARRRSPSPAAKKNTAAIAGTRRSQSKKWSRATSRSNATSAPTAPRNT